jgi:hypothetical protein
MITEQDGQLWGGDETRGQLVFQAPGANGRFFFHDTTVEAALGGKPFLTLIKAEPTIRYLRKHARRQRARLLTNKLLGWIGL